MFLYASTDYKPNSDHNDGQYQSNDDGKYTHVDGGDAPAPVEYQHVNGPDGGFGGTFNGSLF